MVIFAISTMDSSPDWTIPWTIARTIIPRMSSMTAAAMIMRASLVSIRCMSLMMRAVIPTEVATIAAARKSAWFMWPSPRVITRMNPKMNGMITPRTAQKRAALPESMRSFTLVSRPTVNSRNITPSSAKVYTIW